MLMAKYIIKLTETDRGFKIHLPKAWTKNNIGLKDQFIFAETNGPGSLTLYTEGRYILERTQKN
jgi:hypothetical protein